MRRAFSEAEDDGSQEIHAAWTRRWRREHDSAVSSKTRSRKEWCEQRSWIQWRTTRRPAREVAVDVKDVISFGDRPMQVPVM